MMGTIAWKGYGATYPVLSRGNNFWEEKAAILGKTLQNYGLKRKLYPCLVGCCVHDGGLRETNAVVTAPGGQVGVRCGSLSRGLGIVGHNLCCTRGEKEPIDSKKEGGSKSIFEDTRPVDNFVRRLLFGSYDCSD